MDNQQERFLHWFGGIIDGEGAILLNYRWQKRRFLHIAPRIVIANTSKIMVDEIASGLEALHVAFWVTVKPPTGTRKKIIYHLEIAGLKRLARLFPHLRVRSKKQEVEILRRFVESRLQHAGSAKTPYTSDEVGLMLQLYEIHDRKNPHRLYARLLEAGYSINKDGLLTRG